LLSEKDTQEDKMTTEEWLQEIRTFRFPEPISRPRLLYDAQDITRFRERAAQFPEWLEQVHQDGENVLENLAGLLAHDTEPYYDLPSLEAVSTAYLILADERMASAAEQIIGRFLEMPQWVAHVHWPMIYDHAAANTASGVARALDAIANTLSPSRMEDLCRRLVEKAVLPFTQACRERGPFWSRRETESNWRIMTCGDSGLAVLATAEFNPDFGEALTFAAEGVLDTLDYVPAEGDWPEGPGYWLGTLGLGLRFCLALYCATGGQIDLFDHPALGVTGDYIAQLVKPDGSVYNFNDNRPTVGERLAYLSLLAQRKQRPDWGWVAGRSEEMSLLRLLFEDPDLIPEPPQSRAALFRRSGVAMMRSGWQPQDTFVGFKSGPSDVGHSHVDANSFVLAMRGHDLLLDTGTWPYDHPHGFFDSQDRRWNFDANNTVAHNTLLVDGLGQTWGPGNAGYIERFEQEDTHTWLVGNASLAYPDLLLDRRGFRRWLIFISPDLVVVFDEVESDRPRHYEWLFHYGGSISGEKDLHVIRNGDAVATLRWLHPDARRLWRVTDSVRTTYYRDANSGQEVAKQVRYRGFGPIHRARALESLVVISAGEPETWSVDAFKVTLDTVCLTLSGPEGAAWEISFDRILPAVTVNRA
jgi:hypothetical protein